MQIPELYRELIEPLVAHARSLLEKGETLAALAFIGNLTTKDIAPVVMDDSDESTKENSARLIQVTAAVMDADFIFMISEAWSLPQKYMARNKEIMERYGSIGASPFCQDIVAFSLETTHGTWVAMPLIKAKPPSKKRRTIGTVAFEFMPEIQGRFVGLLSKKKNDGGTLH